ncbi:MAG: glycoside hydrolase family 2 TIM barrel-domain containing protein [Alistipes finegoldii]
MVARQSGAVRHDRLHAGQKGNRRQGLHALRLAAVPTQRHTVLPQRRSDRAEGRFVALHGHSADDAAVRLPWYRMLRDANANAVRLHAQVFPRFYLDMADEMGICVLDETAMWSSDGGPKVDAEAFWQACRDHVRGMVLRDRNHPRYSAGASATRCWPSPST